MFMRWHPAFRILHGSVRTHFKTAKYIVLSCCRMHKLINNLWFYCLPVSLCIMFCLLHPVLLFFPFPHLLWCSFSSSLCHITDLSKRKVCSFFRGLNFSGLVFRGVFCVYLLYWFIFIVLFYLLVMAWLTVRANLSWVID